MSELYQTKTLKEEVNNAIKVAFKQSDQNLIRILNNK